MYTVTTEEADNGDFIVKLPDDLLEKMGWNQYTILETILQGTDIIVKEKKSWSTEEAQENIENIIDDVHFNKNIHKIVIDDGKEVLIVPYENNHD